MLCNLGIKRVTVDEYQSNDKFRNMIRRIKESLPVEEVSINPSVLLKLSENGWSDEIILDDNEIEEIDVDLDYDDISFVSLNNNKLTKLNLGFFFHTNSGLEFKNNKIKSISFLERSRLRLVDCSNNLIEEMIPIDGMEEIREFILDYNLIKDISILSNAFLPDIFSMNYNLIEKIGFGLSDCIIELHLKGNKIKKIEGIEKLNTVELIDLSDNQIEKIEGFDGLSRLKTIYLDNNLITRVENIENIPSLKLLSLTGNPIDRIPREFDKIIKF